MFTLFILSRVLFVASTVFILGYVFGNFSKSRTLTQITRVAAVVLIVSFIGSNMAFFRAAGWRYGNFHRSERLEYCGGAADSTLNR
jgi:hypothetical protein